MGPMAGPKRKKATKDKNLRELGVSVAIRESLFYHQACAPRYAYFSINKRRREPVGTCYTSSEYFSKFSEYAPCRTDAWGYHSQGYCQAGFSVVASKVRWIAITLEISMLEEVGSSTCNFINDKMYWPQGQTLDGVMLKHHVFQGPSKTAKNSRFRQNAKITPSEVDVRAELPCGGYFHLHCFISEIFRIFCGTFSRHFLLARNSPGRPGRRTLLPGQPGVKSFSRKFEFLRQARQEKFSAWPAWRVSSQ